MIKANNMEVEKDNMKQIMASVVVLTYNHEKYIAQALQSVLNQKTLFDYEIIVGEDASTDNTLQIVRGFQKKYPEKIRVIAHTENVGASRNAYDCMKECRGKYLASCEGDDFWISDSKLQLQVSFLEAHKDFIGCTHPVRLVDETGQSLGKEQLPWTSEKKIFTLADFKGIYLPGHGASIVRRNLFLDPSFDATVLYKLDRQIADRTNALLWLEKGPFYQLDETMAAYRRIKHGMNLTSQLYYDSNERIKRDYEYTILLERYAKETLMVDGGFKYHKRELFAKAVILGILKPLDHNLEIADMILNDAEDPVWYIAGLGCESAKLLFRRIKTLYIKIRKET